MYQSARFNASCFDADLGPAAPEGDEARQAPCAPTGIAAFLLRVMAYFQGCLASLPRATQHSITVIDSTMDESSEPLMRVRMNRHLSRRLRWLIRRGRMGQSGELRLATANDIARLSLNPGQFMEYCIRVHRMSRVRLYGLGFGRRALRLSAFTMAALQGLTQAMSMAGICAAPLSPD